MNTLLSQLKIYELVVLVAGVLLFLVTLILLIKKPQILLVFFFLISMVMMGFPAIKSVKFSKELLEITMATESVQKNPSDTTAAKELEIRLQNIDNDRLKNNPDALNEVANAHAALGNYKTALSIIDQAVAVKPNDEKALKSKIVIEAKLTEKVDFDKKITELNQIIGNEVAPNNDKAQRVAEILTTMKAPVYVDKQSSLTLAKAFTLVNEKEKALETVNKVTEVHPDNATAISIQTQLQKDTASQTPSTITPELRTRLRNSPIIDATPHQKLIIRN